MRRAVVRAALILPLVALTLSACAEQSPTRPLAPSDASMNVVGAPAWVVLKKVGPAGTYSFDLTIGTGIFPAGDPATLVIPDVPGFPIYVSPWTRIWEANNQLAGAANLGIMEILPPNMQMDSAWITPFVRNAEGTFSELNNYKVTITGTNQFEVAGVFWNRGAYVTVFNSPRTPDTGEGCTPGYWKQPHHLDSWEGYSPNQQFSSVFANAFPGMTLLQVMWQGGGKLKALGRHTVAALLNSASSGVDYDLTTAQVIAKFNAAYASGNYQPTHSEFADLNERQCYLN